jgi:undecaprenyl-diphosphatase
MNFTTILVLAIVQGVAELLPVSSSAHVIMAEKLLGLDPTSPQMVFLLVMLHTGTMFAVIGYFWKSWRASFFSSKAAFVETVKLVAVATAATVVVGFPLKFLIEKVVLGGTDHAEVEHLFGNPYVIASGLTAAGILILVSGLRKAPGGSLSVVRSIWIGAVQGLCLPFRGFSRSGATISTSMLLGVERIRSEEFSFALAVVLTPGVIAIEGHRLLKDQAKAPGGLHDLVALAGPGLLGMVLSFVAGWVALRWLSKWMEQGRWFVFGPYCFVAAVFVLVFGR